MSVRRFTSLGEDDRVRLLLDLGAATEQDFADVRGIILAGLADESWRVRKAAKEAVERHPLAPFLDDLLDALEETGRPGLRNAAVEILSGHVADALGPIVARFPRVDSESRKFMVDIVGGSRSADGLDFLIGALADADPNVASAAAEFLGYHDDPRAVAALMGVIGTAGGWIAFPAVEALGRIGGEGALELLTRLAGDGALREAAVEALGRIGGDGAIPVLVEAFARGHRRLRETALRGIGTILVGRARIPATPEGASELMRAMASPLIEQEALLMELLRHPDSSIAEAAQALLLAAGGRDAFIRVVASLPAEEVDRIVSLLACLPVDNSSMLARELRNADPLVRLISLRSLLARGRFPDGSAAALTALLADAQGHIRGDAARALARAGHGEGWRDILCLLRDPYPDVREKAGAALLSLGSELPELGGAIARAILDEMSAGRVAPVTGLGIAARLCPDDPAVGKAAADLLADSDPAARRAALAALPLTARGAADEEIFFQMMADEDASVRLAALRGCLALPRTPDYARLLLLVSDPATEVASEAARHLAEQGPGDVVEKLWAVAAPRGGLIRLRVVEGLAANSGFRRTGFFRELLNDRDPEVVRIALQAVAAIGGKEELATVLAAMDHPEWRVRLEAVTLASRLGGATVLPLLAERIRREKDPAVAERLAALLAEGR